MRRKYPHLKGIYIASVTFMSLGEARRPGISHSRWSNVVCSFSLQTDTRRPILLGCILTQNYCIVWFCDFEHKVFPAPKLSVMRS